MKHACFTLVELLVVIAAITLLIAILVPSLQNSRQGAKAILCGSNIKQLVLGLAVYETENGTFPHALDDTLLEPPPGGYAGYFQYDRMGWWWFNHIADYSIKDSSRASVIWCPSRQVNNGKLKGSVLCGNYGVNPSICKTSHDIQSRREEFVGTPLSTDDIPRPGETLLIVDSGYSLICWWYASDVAPVPLGSSIEDTAYVPGLRINTDKNLWPGEELDAIEGRHPKKTVNVGFVDGHITRTKADDLFVEKMCDGYKNLRPLWKPK